MDYAEWRQRWPQAANELEGIFSGTETDASGKSESAVQQRQRLQAARFGGLLWRNNVGALPDERGVPVRYGLCNDSPQLNKRVKSADLIGATPLVIEPQHVGRTVGVFTAVETKHANWTFKGNDHERAQMAFLSLVAQRGGLSFFSNGAETFGTVARRWWNA